MRTRQLVVVGGLSVCVLLWAASFFVNYDDTVVYNLDTKVFDENEKTPAYAKELPHWNELTTRQKEMYAVLREGNRIKPPNEQEFIILAESNRPNIGFVLNMGCFLRQQNLQDSILFISLDEYTHCKLREKGFKSYLQMTIDNATTPAESAHSAFNLSSCETILREQKVEYENTIAGDDGRPLMNSRGFLNMMLERMRIAREILHIGYAVFHTDTDVVIMKNFFQMSKDGILNRPGCDVEIQNDMNYRQDIALLSTNVESLPVRMNGGIWLMKPNNRSTEFYQGWMNKFIRFMTNSTGFRASTNEQALLNQIIPQQIKEKKLLLFKNISRPELAEPNANPNVLTMCCFPPLQFPSGYIWVEDVQKKVFDQYTPGPALIHVNWLKTPATKRWVLSRYHLWIVDNDFNCLDHPPPNDYQPNVAIK